MIKSINKRLFLLSLFFNVFFVIVIGVIAANKKDIWISKINDKHLILESELNNAYRLNFLMSTLSTIIPIPEEDINKILNDKSKKLMFLKNIENQFLIIEAAKEKNLFDKEKIEKDANGIVEVIKMQLIIKEFVKKVIYPKINISKEDIDKFYNDMISKGNKELKKYSLKEGKLIIENQLKNDKINLKFSQYIEKLRLEAKIIQNNSILNE